MSSLSEVRVFVLENGRITKAVLKYQYYLSIIYNPKLSLFAKDMERCLGLTGREFWIYCHNEAAGVLVKIYGPGYAADDAIFCSFIRYNFIRVFVEVEKELQGDKTRLVIPRLPGIKSIDELRWDTRETSSQCTWST